MDRFRGDDLPLPAIADSLGVGWVVEGDVQRMGDAIEVHVQLIDPRTDTHAWAETFRRELTAATLFDLQTEISRSVARALASTITGSEEERLARRPTGSLEAHRFYVRGRSLMEQRQSASLERAIVLRPSYAAAHAWRAKIQLSVARPGDALPSARRAAELDPLSRENQGTLVWALVANRRYEPALRAARRATELGRQLPVPSGRPWNYELIALSHLGRIEEMKVLVREADVPVERAPILVMTLAAAGDSAPAERLLSRHSVDEAPVLHAVLHAALGDVDRALPLLREVYPREDVPWDVWGSVHLRYFWPEILGPLREEPGFESLLADVDRHWGLTP